jgi:hypothetical protein
MAEPTTLLSAARQGDQKAAGAAFSPLYEDLRRLARLRKHRTMTLLDTTSLGSRGLPEAGRRRLAAGRGLVAPASAVCDDPRHRDELRGDLDAILNKALKREPAQRYAAVEALAADSRRHLQGELLHARPDGDGRRSTGRWIRRRPSAARAGSPAPPAAPRGAAGSGCAIA